MSRVVCQFSCGAASAVAAKLALSGHGATRDVQIINAFLLEEHEDNRRFAADCESWFGRPITTLRDKKYDASTIQVFSKRQYMMGPNGAPCSRALKRDVLNAWSQPGDVIVVDAGGDLFELTGCAARAHRAEKAGRIGGDEGADGGEHRVPPARRGWRVSRVIPIE